ncbi:hypothetical protein OS31_41720 [Dickeya oryzae]
MEQEKKERKTNAEFIPQFTSAFFASALLGNLAGGRGDGAAGMYSSSSARSYPGDARSVGRAIV